MRAARPPAGQINFVEGSRLHYVEQGWVLAFAAPDTAPVLRLRAPCDTGRARLIYAAMERRKRRMPDEPFLDIDMVVARQFAWQFVPKPHSRRKIGLTFVARGKSDRSPLSSRQVPSDAGGRTAVRLAAGIEPPRWDDSPSGRSLGGWSSPRLLRVTSRRKTRRQPSTAANGPKMLKAANWPMACVLSRFASISCGPVESVLKTPTLFGTLHLDGSNL